METHDELNGYITSRYEQWVRYATLHIRLSGLRIDPSEAVNEVLCSLLERSRGRLERMMGARSGHDTELDYFVMKVLKISIRSPRSPLRYRRGQHCTDRLDESRMPELPTEESADSNEVHELVGRILAEMNLSERDERLFVWKFFDRKPLSKWPGQESRKELYDAYNRIWKQIIIRIREKLSC